MFGYVTINKDELKIKDVKRYQAYYCGVCQDLKDRHGMAAQSTLTYDMTFLSVLLTGLYEGPMKDEQCRCIVHPVKRHWCLRSAYTSYAADMNLLLCYYNLMDDWLDEKKLIPYTVAKLVRSEFRKVCREYPRQARAVRRYMKCLGECERKNSQNLDLGAGLTGELFGEILVYEEDIWSPILRRLGFYLGKFIYLMDAYDDLERDKKTGNYNPWFRLSEREDFLAESEQILTMMMSGCAREFEKLPIVESVDILRNILYSGIWTKYDMLKKKAKENH